jgi:hypothetical protein
MFGTPAAVVSTGTKHIVIKINCLPLKRPMEFTKASLGSKGNTNSIRTNPTSQHANKVKEVQLSVKTDETRSERTQIYLRRKIKRQLLLKKV